MSTHAKALSNEKLVALAKRLGVSRHTQAFFLKYEWHLEIILHVVGMLFVLFFYICIETCVLEYMYLAHAKALWCWLTRSSLLPTGRWIFAIIQDWRACRSVLSSPERAKSILSTYYSDPPTLCGTTSDSTSSPSSSSSTSSSSPPSSPSASMEWFAVIYNWGIYGGVVSSTVLALGCVLAACCSHPDIRAWATLNWGLVGPGGASTRESHPGLLLSSLTPHVGAGAVGASMRVYDCGHAKEKNLNAVIWDLRRDLCVCARARNCFPWVWTSLQARLISSWPSL